MFTELYPRLVRYATQLLGDGEEARDIVGSVMEQAWKQFEKLEPENRGAWLYTAARNACLNRLKHLQVEATNLEALRDRPHGRSDRLQEHGDCNRRKALPVTYRNRPAVLRLCYYEHKTYREVAEQLGISPDTVKNIYQSFAYLARSNDPQKEETDDGRKKMISRWILKTSDY